MVALGLAAAAAPTHHRKGYVLVDGVAWADSPVMLAVTETLTCSTVEPIPIDV